MPELVTCPSCGCRFQAPRARRGKRTRCPACDTSIHTEVGPLTLGDVDYYPLVPPENALIPPRPPPPLRGRPRLQEALCPGCHRPVGWDVPGCPHCGHLFAEEGESPPVRRDGASHRGELIDRLGSASLIFGMLTLGLGPIGLVVALATGLPALAMARRDLPRMATSLVDPAGLVLTDWGANKAVVGVTFAAVGGVFWGLLLFHLLW
ncbi:MAG: hypothetical protein U0797_06215 [Gemmataceae bacterium]